MRRLYIYHPQPLKKQFVLWVGSQNVTYILFWVDFLPTSPMDAMRLALDKTSEVKVASRQVRKDHVN